MSRLVQDLRTGAQYLVGPGNYVAGFFAVPGIPEGFVPFDIRLLRFGMHYSAFTGGASVQNLVGGSLAGPVLIANASGSAFDAFDDEIIVPGVTVSTIDTTARWGVTLGGNPDPSSFYTIGMSWDYEPILAVHAGKQIMGLGSTTLIDTGSDQSTGIFGEPNVGGYFAPLVFPRATMDFFIPGGTDSMWFMTPFETQPDKLAYMIANGTWGEARPVAAWPWLTPGTFQDFTLVLKTIPSAGATLSFRKNKQTLFSFTVTAGWRYYTMPNVVSCSPGDLFCWHCTAAGAQTLDAQLLWTFTPGTSDSSGYGELGYGEGGYGTM